MKPDSFYQQKVIYSAISPVAYHFIPQVAAGDVFGPDIEVSIRLVDSEFNKEQLEGKLYVNIQTFFTKIVIYRHVIV